MPDRKQHKATVSEPMNCRAVVIWIDWYAYHFARFSGLQDALGRNGEVRGIELVGGVGVHEGLHFREGVPKGLPVETLMPESSWRNANKLRLAKLLWSRLNALNPEVVLVPGYYTLPAISAALWARLHKRASVLMTESTSCDHARTGWKETLKSHLIRTLFNWAVTGGSAHIRYLRQLGFAPERIVKFYDVVNNEGLASRVARLRLRNRTAFSGLDQYFLYVGRLAAEKNVGTLLRAWIAYRETGGMWPLVIVGDGPEAATLISIAEDSNFGSHVHFAGHRRSEELPPYYAFAGCFVLPSTREPWGLVVNEAMACSLPVLVSNRCGCAEDLVADGWNGFVFDPNSAASLTPLLHSIALLSTRHRARMSQSSAELIQDFSPVNFGREIALIAELSQWRSKRPHPKPQPAIAE